MPVLTASEQNQSPELVLEQPDIPIVNPDASSNFADSAESQSQGQVCINHPQLQTKVFVMKLRLGFLKRCRFLKRPPVTLRVKSSKLINPNLFIKTASKAESELLEAAIKDMRLELDGLENLIHNSDLEKLSPVKEIAVTRVQSTLDKKFLWLKKQDAGKWASWPCKKYDGVSQTHLRHASPIQKFRSFLSSKKSRNVIKKQRRIKNKITAIAKSALEEGTVVNLSDAEIPPEVIALLTKRTGFVLTPTHNSLEMRNDCYTAMANLSGATTQRNKSLANTQDITHLSREPIIPQSLKRDIPRVCYSSGDKFIDELTSEVMAQVDLLKPPKHKSNLNKLERNGLKWILNQLNDGDLRVVSADKGGALCIIPKSVMVEFEQHKLNNKDHYENLGIEDPTKLSQDCLLNIWREGENNNFVTRDEAYEVVGLCESKNNKPQRVSTSSSFKAQTPYFYGLLKIHKLDPVELKPGAKIPIRLVTDLSHSVTSRSDKFLNWKFLQSIEEEFCKDLAKDSTEVINWLENLNKEKPEIQLSMDSLGTSQPFMII